jgi:hypothetical protein
VAGNDDFANGVQMPVVNGSVSLPGEDNTGATLEDWEPFGTCDSSKWGATLWYWFVAPDDGTAAVGADSEDPANPGTFFMDPVVNVWREDPGDVLTRVACNDDANGKLSSQTSAFSVGNGNVYDVEVGGICLVDPCGHLGSGSADQGSFDLSIAFSRAATGGGGGGGGGGAGGAAPPGRINANVTMNFTRFRKFTRLDKFKVDAPPGATTHVVCHGPCPFSQKSYSADSNLKTLFPHHHASRGELVEIFVTQAGAIGDYTSFKFRGSKKPQRTDACIQSGTASTVVPC